MSGHIPTLLSRSDILYLETAFLSTGILTPRQIFAPEPTMAADGVTILALQSVQYLHPNLHYFYKIVFVLIQNH